jgi:hypothetical protein
MVNKLLPRKPKQPLKPPPICLEGRELIQPPLWWGISLSLPGGPAGGSPTLSLGVITIVSPPGIPMGTPLFIKPVGEPSPVGQLVFVGVQASYTIIVDSTHYVLQLTLTDMFNRYIETQFARIPRF